MALAHALIRQMGADFGDAMDAPFSFGDHGHLTELFQAIPFSDFTIPQRTMNARFNFAEVFTRDLAVGSGLRRTGVRIAREALHALSVAVAVELH